MLRQQCGYAIPRKVDYEYASVVRLVYRFDDPQADDLAAPAVHQVGFSPQIGSHHGLCADSI
jgi:hypothetical protein